MRFRRCKEILLGLPDSRSLMAKPLIFPTHDKTVFDYFVSIARSLDTAAVQPKQVLYPLSTGRRGMVFPSWANAEAQIADLKGKVQVIGYNPEQWDLTPLDEKQNLVKTCYRAQEAAHRAGMLFLLIPDRRFLELYGASLASTADWMTIQGQRIQNNPTQFRDFMRKNIDILKRSNPAVLVNSQVGTATGAGFTVTARQMYDAIATVADRIDGISIWTTPATLSILKQFVGLVRPR